MYIQNPQKSRNVYYPTALRKAKTVYNFGLSKCNRVKSRMAKPCFIAVGRTVTNVKTCGLTHLSTFDVMTNKVCLN